MANGDDAGTLGVLLAMFAMPCWYVPSIKGVLRLVDRVVRSKRAESLPSG